MRNFLIIAIIISLLSLLTFCTQNNTADNLDSPYLNQSDTVQYVGMETCRTCHADKFETYIHTGMGMSFGIATRTKSDARFGEHDVVYDSIRNFYYKPFWKNDSLYVKEYRLLKNDTVHLRIEQINYIVGSGQHTNSHMLRINGYLYQAPITFYTQKQQWDLAPGMEGGFNSRFSRIIESECLACHNGLPQPVVGSINKYVKIPNGIDCERCHGPGSLHVATINKGIAVDTANGIDYTIVNPGNLSVDLQNNLCFRCHLQGVDVLNDGASFFDFKPGDHIRDHWNIFLPQYDGKNNLFLMASQADRMLQSKCFIETQQLSCITCHNPHITVKETPVSQFNAPCLSCHNNGKDCTESIAARNLKQDNCSGCHIPKSGSIDIPHVSISDHKIQIPGKDALKEDGQFVRLIALTDSNASPVTMAKGYLKYFEAFTHQPVMLDSAWMWLQKVKIKDEAYYKASIHYHYLNGNFKQIIAEASKLNSMKIPDAWTYYRIGESYFTMQDFPNAVVYFKKAVDVLPYNLDFNLKLGSAYFRVNNFSDAQKVFAFIINENPKYQKAWMNLGAVYLQNGNYSEAESALLQAIQLDPDYLQARLTLVDLYINTRQKQKAKEELKYLQAYYPDDIYVKQMQQSVNSL